MATTDPQEERLTEVDRDNHVIGPIARKLAHESKDKYYRTVYILVFDTQGRVLIQERSATKDLYPNCWDLSVGGHVGYGQSYHETAVREMSEELGVHVAQSELKLKGEVLVTLPSSNEYFYIYEYYLQPKDKIKIEKSEINNIAWMTIDEIKNSMNNKSIKWYERPIQVINALY